MRKPVFGVPTRLDTNGTVQPQEMARGSKFRIYKVEGSENKDDDQLISYCAPDLRLCFRICEKKNRFSHHAA